MIRFIALLIALGAGTALYALAGGSNPASTEQAAMPITFINQQDAAKHIASGMQTIDVRSGREWNNGRIAGALHIPFQEIAQRLPASIGVETPVLLYCKSGGRASRAAKAIKALGYQQIFVLKPNGYAELQQALDAHRASQ